MLPILFTVGNFPVSSFGLFLGLGIFFGSFSVWRITKSFEFDFEKVLDLIFLTVGSGFIFSRLVFVLANISVFDSFTKVFFINRYPGLSFWGGFFGGLIALWWLTKRSRISFFQAADIGIIGYFMASFWTEIGCLLGACGGGIETISLFGVDQEGVIGKRLPVQVFEALSFLILFMIFWKGILRFHIQGSFFAKGLIWLGLIKLFAGYFKSSGTFLKVQGITIMLDTAFSLLVILIGFYFYYKINKRTPLADFRIFLKFFVSRQMQKSLMIKIYRGWYNQKANLIVGFGRLRKRLLKFLNIRSNPETFK